MHLGLTLPLNDTDVGVVVTDFHGYEPATWDSPAEGGECSWHWVDKETEDLVDSWDLSTEAHNSFNEDVYNAAEEALIEQAKNDEADAADYGYECMRERW